MVPVPLDHLRHVAARNLLPALISDVLPAWNLLEHQQPDLIAGVKKVRRLRIVRGAHQVALQLLLQDERVSALHARGHRLPNIRVRLVPVQSTQLHVSPVQMETLGSESGITKANAGLHLVAGGLPFLHAYHHLVQLRRVQIPQLHAGQVQQ